MGNCVCGGRRAASSPCILAAACGDDTDIAVLQHVFAIKAKVTSDIDATATRKRSKSCSWRSRAGMSPLRKEIHYCMGVLENDCDSAVLNKNGKAIPGLSAAGEIAGGVHGSNKLGGHSLLHCVAVGRRQRRGQGFLQADVR